MGDCAYGCKERGEMLYRALNAVKQGDGATVNREMVALGQSFGTDAKTIADNAKQRIATAMSSRPGR